MNKNHDSVPIAREGIPFILLPGFFTIVVAILQLKLLAFLGLLATFFATYFFRDPQRIIPHEKGVVVSPADGKIVAIEPAIPPSCFNLQGSYTKISVFMSIFDVHVNRSPCDGTIRDVKYFKGSFIAAQKSKASSHNERNCILIETPEGSMVTVVQIAGLIARRIVFWKGHNQPVRRGERIGMIRFGSRVDLYVPASWEITISTGARVKGGEDILCKQA